MYTRYIYLYTHTHIYIHLLLLCLARWCASLQPLWEWFRNSSLVTARIMTLMKPNIWEKWKCQSVSRVWLFETPQTATFGKKTPTTYPPVYQCLPCGEIQNEWGLPKEAETERDWEHKSPTCRVLWYERGTLEAQRMGVKKKPWITRKWHWTWSRLVESVSNVFHPCQAFG